MKPAHRQRKETALKPQGENSHHKSKDSALLWLNTTVLEKTMDKAGGCSMCRHIMLHPQSETTQAPERN